MIKNGAHFPVSLDSEGTKNVRIRAIHRGCLFWLLVVRVRILMMIGLLLKSFVLILYNIYDSKDRNSERDEVNLFHVYLNVVCRLLLV